MQNNLSTLDILTIILFLALTIYVGLRASKQVHDTKDYAIGGKSYGSFAILATLSASYIGGGYTFGVSEKVFSYGIIYIVALLGFSLQQILVATWIAPKMGQFKNAISVGDMMQDFYGKQGRAITAIASFLVCSGIVGAQINAMGYVFYLFLDIPTTYGILIGTSIVILYAAIGGMHSVIATDILQFMILIIMIPLTFILSLIQMLQNDITTLVSHLQPYHLSFMTDLGPIFFISIFLSLFLGEALVPPYVQRLLIGKTLKQTIRGTFISALISIPFFIAVGLIGVIAYFYAPDLNPNLALPQVINLMLPAGLKGLAISAMISVIMSSADSYLNASSVAIVHDFYKSLINPNLSQKSELKWMKWMTFIVGASATYFALTIESVLDILLYSYNFWAPIILIPLVMGITTNYRISPKQFGLLTALTFFFMIFWNQWIGTHIKIENLIAGIAFNLVLYLIFMKRHQAQ